ncbi:type IV pilus secretin PilQ [Ectothiorhodospira lacustris]|uniref:type IV pilus secretin PilQ n=1 Tax=Ectothiorhodospira lacustris TaxID=2899127 RepID=UPI001EE88FF2|nr:type IV pilus secretin PilQ [Ectothiorhodospira lacustris]MCG5501885.1 type IV pilus secretin PilQ [Ectothiorhodospira lacustris]MCG5509828.1 type IV pilus secretin PilQ [Ectothiorhodospira lacustris]MCG5521081.1 type IV pilus secretin PilQ [Ectothiorhodospira lacustris]
MTPATLRRTQPRTAPAPRSPGRPFALLVLCLLALCWQSAAAQTRALEQIIYNTLPGDRLQVIMRFTAPPPEPMSFTIDNPARIALDFPETRNALPQRSQTINMGLTQSVNSVEASGRTRVVFNLVRMMSYDTRRDGNDLVLTLAPAGAPATAAAPPAVSGLPAPTREAPSPARQARGISNVDFRRGPEGEGRVIIALSDPRTPVDVREQDGRIELSFHRTHLPERLERRLDVTDFATPVQTIDAVLESERVRISVAVTGEYDVLSYQAEGSYTLEVKPLTREQREILERERFVYTGERLSLNFQDIEVRSVLQLIADFTDLNVVVSDTVTGNITLRLRNVPWDQALDIILKTKGLALRQNGNVLFVAPSEEIAARERLELESQRQAAELAPVRAEFIQVNYARAADVAGIISGDQNRFLSERGSITVDSRTNTLLVQDTADTLQEIRRLINTLDIPVQQVLIETRIVVATDDFARDLGVRFGVTGVRQHGDTIYGTGGGLAAADGIIRDAVNNLNTSGSPFPVDIPSLNDRLNVNMPVTSPAGSIGLSILRPDVLLDLELTALQVEGRGEIVSTPRVITANGQTAVIKQGERIPYEEATTSGATAIQFIDAVLSTEVTPQITPNGNIILNIRVNKDNAGTREVRGTPSIETREVNTQVFVRNGETVVLGGIYEITSLDQLRKTPFLGDLPIIGQLFRQRSRTENKAELLVFVTPKVVEESTLNR